MEINGGEVIEVAKMSSPAEEQPPPPDSRPISAGRRQNPDRAEADSQLPEQENGPQGKADIANDDQDPGGEIKDEEEAAAVEKAAKAAAGSLNLAEDAPPDGEAVVNGEIVMSKNKEQQQERRRGEEDYQLDKAVAEENNL